MNKKYISQNIQEIIDDLNSKNFEKVIKKIELLSEKKTDVNFEFWKEQIEIYEKSFLKKIDKFKLFINIGVIFFKLGKITDSINFYKFSIQDNPNFSLAYNNLGISYLEIGMFEKAAENFEIAFKLNTNDISAQKHLINILNLVIPNDNKYEGIIKLNYKINTLIKNLKIKNYFDTKNIKKILNLSNNLIDNFENDLVFNETQIFRKNSTNLNCLRHFKVFNEFNIIPEFCFSCYKIQINLFTVVDLIKLYFIFDNINLIKNNMRKCMVETRNQIRGNYKGYIYCTGLEEAKSILELIKEEIKLANLNKFKIAIKHGCSEFYQSYPEYEKINFDGEQIMKYNQNWSEKEKLVDERIPKRNDKDKKIWGTYVKGINLSDVLIINNWMNYADIIGDFSYKKIFENTVKSNFLNKILESQVEFRKNNFFN
tara:strand:- start:20 stop:1300 length:1281 start_codon:yes stop_codon:yes gene_type:complete